MKRRPHGVKTSDIKAKVFSPIVANTYIPMGNHAIVMCMRRLRNTKHIRIGWDIG